MNRSRLQFALACALSMVTEPDRWVALSGSDEGHEEHLDRASIQRNGDKVTLWTRRDFVTQQRTVWNEIEVDCSTRRDTILAFIQDDAENISHNFVRPHRAS